MDQLAREDIAAAAAVHHELGREYDDAVAESLVERIGAEIDKRVDTRLGQRGRRPAPRDPAEPVSPSRRSSFETILVALGSMTIGGITAVSILNGGHAGGGAVVALIWVVIAVINIAYARRR